MTALEQVEETHFGGVYRGVVVSSTDPTGQGRVQVKVPAINGDGILGWAMPCMPFVMADSLLPRIPQPGEPAWVMFEHGSIDFPVYLGTWRI